MIGEADSVNKTNTQVFCYYQLWPNLHALTQDLTIS